MGQNYLTTLKVHIMKHLRDVFTLQDTSGLTEAEVKSAVDRMVKGTAVPIPNETYVWLRNYFAYVRDKGQLLVYDNRIGLWRYETDEISLRNLLTDYFTALKEMALAAGDMIHARYASAFFVQGRITNLAKMVMTSVIIMEDNAHMLERKIEHIRYFTTTDGRRAIIDVLQNKFNLRSVTFPETQKLHLQHIAPQKISTVDEEPTLWLSLIAEYMMQDPVKIEYFEKVLAYMMSPYNYNQAFIYFVGGGRNGKGTVVKVLQDILGPYSIRMNAELLNADPSSSFKKDDALAATEGRSLLVFNEIDERMIASTQNIKDLTEGGRDASGNRMMTVVRPAYSRNYEVCIQGIPLIIANSLMNFGDWSQQSPIFRRLVLVPFDYTIAVEDPTLLDRLAAEYPKIQLWLYQNYFKHKGVLIKDVPRPASFERMFIQYQSDSDILQLFVAECVVATPTNPANRILTTDLYAMYRKYCLANGRRPIRNKGTNGFQTLVQKHLDALLVSTTMINGSGYYVGVERSPMYDRDLANFPG